MTAIDTDIRNAIQAVVDYNWSRELADYQQQDSRGRTHHIFGELSRIAAWLNSNQYGEPVPEDSDDERTPSSGGHFLGWIEWDLEGFDGPREAAEALWEYVQCSPGPVVELENTEDGERWRVDLEREPGDGDAVAIGRGRPARIPPSSTHNGGDRPT